MKKYILVFIMISLLFNIDVSFSKMGFGKSTGFRSYKSYKFYKKQKTLKQRNYKQKLTQKKISTNRRPSFLNNPIFRWLIGGMIFGALLSFLLGYGFHIGAPGLLEILLIVGIIYFLFKKFKTSYQPTPETTAGIPVPEEEKKEEIPISDEFLKNFVKDMFIKLQKEWSKGNLSPLRKYFTDRLYNHLEMELIDLMEKKQRNVIEDINIKNVEIIHREKENSHEVAIAEIDAEMVDYIVDEFGNIIKGSKDKPVKVKEYWVLVGSGLNWKLDDIKEVEE